MSNPAAATAAFVAASAPRPVPGTEITLQPFCMAHAYALDSIGNPLARGAEMSAQDLFRIAALLSLPGRAACDLAADADKLSAAARDLSLDLPPAIIEPLARTLVQHIQEAFAPHLPPAQTGELQAPARAGVASAGASLSSPTSKRNSTSRTLPPSTKSRSRSASQSAPQATPQTAANSRRRTTASKTS